MGACALQVGHQEAWIATRIGLPAFCASAKALASKDGAVSAKAGETTMAVAIREAFRIERRDNMETLLLVAVPEVTFSKLPRYVAADLCAVENPARSAPEPDDRSTARPRRGRAEPAASPPTGRGSAK